MPESEDADSDGENEPHTRVIFDDSSTEILRRSARAPARVRGIDDLLETELKRFHYAAVIFSDICCPCKFFCDPRFTGKAVS
jgi:hypothetical protein